MSCLILSGIFATISFCCLFKIQHSLPWYSWYEIIASHL